MRYFSTLCLSPLGAKQEFQWTYAQSQSAGISSTGDQRKTTIRPKKLDWSSRRIINKVCEWFSLKIFNDTSLMKNKRMMFSFENSHFCHLGSEISILVLLHIERKQLFASILLCI
jgi:hypothetical protein